MSQDRKRVVFFGDSLTRADYLKGGFVEILAGRWRDVEVLNHGENGDTTDDLLARLDQVRAVRPDWVWLMVGTNDCGWGIPAADYMVNLREIVRLLRPARIVLVTPTTSVFYRGANAPYVSAVEEVGRVEGLPVIDFASEIQDSDFGFDGLHWNEEGHRRLAEKIDLWWQEARDFN